MSTRLAADVGGYLAGLALFRLEQHEPWVRWFAEAVSGAGQAQSALVQQVEELKKQWRAQLGARRDGRLLRGDSSAWRLLDLLPRHLVLTTALVATETGQSIRSANKAFGALVEPECSSSTAPRDPGARGGRLGSTSVRSSSDSPARTQCTETGLTS